MKRTAPTVAWTAAALLLATAVSGCSSGSKSSSSTAASPSVVAKEAANTAEAGYIGGGSSSPSGSPSGQATVTTKSAGNLGTILVDAKGRTLYLFKADTSDKSTCTGTCATVWPPMLTHGSPKNGASAKQNLLGTTKRSGGASQVTYNKHPLYYYAADSKPGQTTGQGLNQFGALWYVLDPAGKQVTKSS